MQMVRYMKLLRRASFIRKFENNFKYHNKRFIVLGDTNDNFFRPGWETCDLINADYTMDFRNGLLPFKDGSIDAFYSSHMIEHISYDDCLNLAQDIHRCLRPGGYFRVVTPNMDILLDRYFANDWKFFLQADGIYILDHVCKGKLPPESMMIHNRLVGWFASYSGRLDTGGGPIVDKETLDTKLRQFSKYKFRDWCVSLLDKERIYAHIHLYDYCELSTLLKKAGFQDVQVMTYGNSSCKEMQYPTIDVATHQMYSLYIECIK